MLSHRSLFIFILFIFSIKTSSAQLFRESQDSLNTGSGELYGTLFTPSEPKEKIPVVLIIAGSGPTDRNGNNIAGINCNAYEMLADSLAKYGIASLRYDKRGVAASRSALADESKITIDVYINDAKMWMEKLESDPRFSKIIVLGHSEGSLLEIVACARTKADALISVAGIGRSADQILREQLSNLPDTLKNECYGYLTKLKSGDTISHPNPLLNSLFRPSVQPYLISWFKYNPSEETEKLKIPVLIVQGTHDIQVDTSDAILLHKACPQSQLAMIDGMNHIMKVAPADRADNIKTYSDPGLPLDGKAVKTIVDFINGLKQ